MNIMWRKIQMDQKDACFTPSFEDHSCRSWKKQKIEEGFVTSVATKNRLDTHAQRFTHLFIYFLNIILLYCAIFQTGRKNRPTPINAVFHFVSYLSGWSRARKWWLIGPEAAWFPWRRCFDVSLTEELRPLLPGCGYYYGLTDNRRRQLRPQQHLEPNCVALSIEQVSVDFCCRLGCCWFIVKWLAGLLICWLVICISIFLSFEQILS